MGMNRVRAHEVLPVPQILWQSCDGMMVIDDARQVVAINPTLEQWTGCSSDQVVGQSECGALLACKDLHGCALADQPEQCPGLRAMQLGKPVQGAEYTIRSAGGRRMVVSASYTPVQLDAGMPRWTLVILREITQQKRRERELLRGATTDPLTGLPNRTSFLEACRSELTRAARYGRPLAVAMIDIDGFKGYNDRYGHLAGDDLLKSLCRVLRTSARGGEHLARFGGDEFLLLMPETDTAGALIVAERLRQTVAGFPFAHPAEPLRSAPASDRPPRITLSIGVAVFRQDGDGVEALLAKADQRLFIAKQQGRNRVVSSYSVIQERRAQPRINLTAAAIVHRTGEPLEGPGLQGTVRNLSLGGAHLLVPPGAPVSLNEILTLSIAIPRDQQRLLPLASLRSRGRVVRVDAADPARAPYRFQPGVAVAFEGDLFMLAAGA